MSTFRFWSGVLIALGSLCPRSSPCGISTHVEIGKCRPLVMVLRTVYLSEMLRDLKSNACIDNEFPCCTEPWGSGEEKARDGVVQDWGLTTGVRSVEEQEASLVIGSLAVSPRGEIGTG